MHQALAELDSETVISSEMSVRGKRIPTYEDVIKFVKEQAKILNLNRNAVNVDKISDELPRLKIDRSFLSSLGDVQLASDEFDEPTEIDGIIGAELFATIMGNDSYNSPTGSPLAVQTVFGYVIMGKVPIFSWVADSNVIFNSKEE
ncbi:hypothetical protein JTB14_013176 [Gonioctena quinquepunctata]|nr:hypothetical protein JTB14_013176 [Gonioctena quinquepunctata]